ncbi:MAG: 30S ribosomal protein S4 [Oscillospiraceae bacterium]|nr:30S ribosomal protein S4 [Oscillospiraceae bacterium]
MARYSGAVCRYCRREKQKLFLKGDRCYSPKCSVAIREYPPGQHGQGRKKPSEYGMQLREKQKARRHYGVLERQFAHYFELAAKMKGQSGENLLSLLERRLDNVVYRMGLAMSRPEARALVTHRHFCVDGKSVNIPSFLVRTGMTVALKPASRRLDKFVACAEVNSARPVPRWMDMDFEAFTARIVALPAREDIDLPLEENRIVELYSK